MTPAAARRVIHAATGAVVLLPLWIGWTPVRWGLTGLIGVAAAAEIIRIRSLPLGRWFSARVPLFRPHESGRPSGAFWLCAAYAVCSWFPPSPALVGMLSAAWADPAASWIGSKTRSGRSKTWPGSAAALVVAGLVGLVGGLSPGVTVATAIAAAAVERWSGPFDDNLLVGPVASLTVLLLAG